jgi:transposase
MEILEAFDLTRCAWSAAQLVGCDPKTVGAYVARRDAGLDPLGRLRRPRLIDPFLAKIEELVDRSQGKIRADVVHERLVAMGFGGVERTTRRAVAELKAAWQAGRGRVYRPWVPEPGMWLQFDWGDGPRVGGRRTCLFCAWLAWSRCRVVIPTWDQTLGTLVWCLDQTLRRVGGAPTYLLTDNAKTVTTEHVAGVPVRHPEMVAVGRHYGGKVESCVAYDPQSKGGVEATVKLAKADLVPTTANLLDDYLSFTELTWACERFCEQVNAREHRETRQAPMVRLATERAHLHVLPATPHTLALGEDRLVKKDQTVSWVGCGIRPRPGGAARACGAAPRARNWSSSVVVLTVWRRSAATGCRSLATRASLTSTTQATLVAGTCTRPSPSPAPPRRLHSWRSGRAPTAGWSRPQPPAPRGSAAR